ncbi:tryptophan-rich sensory protein [Patescibacteria group bacterium]|nr:tryptophan-rich sensory protein [Patescibacteria group bacterium]MBU4098999.1 tryptophan-rich sensory protein [Patescibacteria group bacterium]
MRDFSKLIISVTVCELIGLLSTPFTISSIPTWYAGLIKPFFSPPNWIFAPVWTTLYFLMGVSVYLIWRKGIENKEIKIAIYYFITQLFFNFFWSIFFFGLRLPLVAFIDIIVLLAAIVLTMMKFYKISKVSLYLLIPYLLWVSFATILNMSIVLLNR